MNMTTLDIRNDIIFKAVFGREDPRCKKILTSLLNAILDLKNENRIQILEYKNPFNLQEIPKDKLTIMDIKVKTGTGEWIDVEMQMSAYDAYRKRSLYYWASLYKDSLQKAERFHELKKCIIISIMNTKIFYETQDYHNCFWISEKKKCFPLNEDLELHFIELESFDDTREVDNLTEFERWVMYLKDEGNETKNEKLQQIMAEEEAIEMANQVFNEVTSDDRMRELVLSIENAKRDQASREYEAELKGMTKGIEQGKRQGIEQGIEQGIQAGKLETAKALLLDGATPEFVVKITKLDISVIEKLQKEMT